MSDVDTELQDELSTLKARADLLGVKYHPSISAEKLREKINAHLKPEDSAPGAESDSAAVETEHQKVVRLQAEAAALVRVRVTCMNPAKKEWEGEIFTVGNSIVGTYKKFVPFNADEGWHIPQIMLDVLRARECQIFTSVKDGRGNTVRKGKIIKEFAIEVLPPLTEEELKELAQRQAMARSVD